MEWVDKTHRSDLRWKGSASVKGKVYEKVVRPTVTKLKMLRFSLGVTRMDIIRNEYIRRTALVGRFGDNVREARLRWCGHVQRRGVGYIGLV